MVGRSTTASSPEAARCSSIRAWASQKATGERDANVIGYCLGGTLLAATLGHLAAKKEKRIASATFMTSLIDFTAAGELEVFIDEAEKRVWFLYESGRRGSPTGQ